jgi:fructose-1,6-bisphosphatase/inositol monophosphatase family enzyme
MEDLPFIENNLINIISKARIFFIDKENHCSNLDIKEKSYQDYVTKLDIEIQKYLIDSISTIFPGFEIYSEENIKDVTKLKRQNLNSLCGEEKIMLEITKIINDL